MGGTRATAGRDEAMDDTCWQDWYRLHGPQRPYAHRPGLAGADVRGEIEYAGGMVLRLADLVPPRPNYRESTDGTLREREEP
jgi:hypothetical protein